jgi:hypothetical protein
VKRYLKIFNHIFAASVILATSCTKYPTPKIGSGNQIIINTGNTSALINNRVKIQNSDIICPPGTDLNFTRGICYQDYHYEYTPTVRNKKTTAGAGPGFFDADLNNIYPGKVYYYRAYMEFPSDGVVIYGNTKSISIPPGCPTIEIINDAYNIGRWTASVSGTIVDDGGSGCDQYGFVISKTNVLPTINDGLYLGGTGVGVSNHGMAVTFYTLTEGTTYYVRAYARNSKCLTGVYSKVITFTTRP